jgi:glycosyltransferase involved in cell wall biosynthesis
VFRKKNGGVSSARNAALDAAKGDYILFLDSDDYLEPNAIGVMVAAAVNAGAVFVGAGWRDVDEDGRTMRSTTPRRSSMDYYAAVATSGLAVGGVLTKRRVDIRFNETRPWEAWEVDEYFLEYLSCEEKVIFIDEIVVNRRQSNNPERLTNKLDHFEPMKTGAFFGGLKERLAVLGVGTEERFAVLDGRILSSIHSLLYAYRYDDATILARNINRDLLGRYAALRLWSFAWFFKWGGMKAARSFVAVNRLFGR